MQVKANIDDRITRERVKEGDLVLKEIFKYPDGTVYGITDYGRGVKESVLNGQKVIVEPVKDEPIKNGKVEKKEFKKKEVKDE